MKVEGTNFCGILCMYMVMPFLPPLLLQIKREICIMKIVRHPNVVCLHEVCVHMLPKPSS